MVVQTQPENIADAPVIIASSDAPDNLRAIRDIDTWARENGFVRSNEYHLGRRQALDGTMLFFSPCYRLDESFHKAGVSDLATIRANREKMPMTASSDVLLQEG